MLQSIPKVLMEAPSVSLTPNTLAQYMSDISTFLSANLTRAADDMKRFADAGRKPSPKYKPGDKVLLSTKKDQHTTTKSEMV